MAKIRFLRFLFALGVWQQPVHNFLFFLVTKLKQEKEWPINTIMPTVSIVHSYITLNNWKVNLIIKTVEKWLECIEKYSCYCLLSSHYLIYSSPALSSASNHMLQCSIYLGSFGSACAFISETAIKIWWKRKASWDCSRFPDPSWMLRGGKGSDFWRRNKDMTLVCWATWTEMFFAISGPVVWS